MAGGGGGADGCRERDDQGEQAEQAGRGGEARVGRVGLCLCLAASVSGRTGALWFENPSAGEVSKR